MNDSGTVTDIWTKSEDNNDCMNDSGTVTDIFICKLVLCVFLVFLPEHFKSDEAN